MHMHTTQQTARLSVLDGEVSCINPRVVLVEVADHQHQVMCTDQLADSLPIGKDGVARPLRRGPTRQHSRRALRHVRTAIGGQRIVRTLQGRTP